MTAIVAVDKNFGIGYKGNLLFSLPEDMKFFRETTKNSTVVMGRGTFLSLPGAAPLKGRRNIVLSANAAFVPANVTVCRSAAELTRLIQAEPYGTGEIFVIGGGRVYRELLPLCNKAYVTKIDAARPADAFFPDIDKEPGWTLAHTSEPLTHEGVSFCFCTYVRR
jgi:dihydrofolate reductase